VPYEYYNGDLHSYIILEHSPLGKHAGRIGRTFETSGTGSSLSFLFSPLFSRRALWDGRRSPASSALNSSHTTLRRCCSPFLRERGRQWHANAGAPHLFIPSLFLRGRTRRHHAFSLKAFSAGTCPTYPLRTSAITSPLLLPSLCHLLALRRRLRRLAGMLHLCLAPCLATLWPAVPSGWLGQTARRRRDGGRALRGCTGCAPRAPERRLAAHSRGCLPPHAVPLVQLARHDISSTSLCQPHARHPPLTSKLASHRD